MSETLKVLSQTNPSAATLTDSYTVPALASAVISTLAIANRSGVATAYRVSVAVAGAANNDKQYLAYDVAIAGNAYHTLTLGITLGAADVVRVYATLATLSFSCFGVERS